VECDDRAAQEGENDCGCRMRCVMALYGDWSYVEVSVSGCALLSSNCGRR